MLLLQNVKCDEIKEFIGEFIRISHEIEEFIVEECFFSHLFTLCVSVKVINVLFLCK